MEVTSKELANKNLVRNMAGIIKKSKARIEAKIFMSIIVSSGVRSTEAIKYKFVGHVDSVVILEVPLLKKRKEQKRQIQVDSKLFGLQWFIFRDFENMLGGVQSKQRMFKKYLGLNPTDYRSLFTIWLLLKQVSLPEVRDILGHSSIKVTDEYIKSLTVDYVEITKL